MILWHLTLASLLLPSLPLPESSADERFLHSVRVPISAQGLIDFFRKRCLSDEDRDRIRLQVRLLGSIRYADRIAAARELVSHGRAALAYLKAGMRDPDPEIARRCQACYLEIELQPASEAQIAQAAARQLVKLQAQGAVDVLLDYLAFHSDAATEDEILIAMRSLPLSGKERLLDRVEDAHAARRAAVAVVLGRQAIASHRIALVRLLLDSDAHVQFRAAEGLVQMHDKEGVPKLIALLTDTPSNISRRAEDLLHRLAGTSGPHAKQGYATPQARQKYRQLWEEWWTQNQRKLDWSRIQQEQGDLGLCMVAEMDSNQVWEFDREGRVRWRITKLEGPMQAQMLAGDRILISEYQGRRVTERDLQGAIHWSHTVAGNPIWSQRLPDGNTFIATHTSYMEISRDGREVYQKRFGAGLFVFGASKLPNGLVLCIANPGLIEEFDPVTGKVHKSIRLGSNFGGWCGVESLSGGRYLVALCTSGKVQELDETGKVAWEASVPNASHAIRLPNGNTIAAGMMNHRVVELDRDGKLVREITTEGRPWRLQYR